MDTILFYINSLTKGGAERVMTNLANGFSRDGYKTILVTSISEQAYELDRQVEHPVLEKSGRKHNFVSRNIECIKGLYEICKEKKPDIVVSFLPESDVRAIIAAKCLSIPVIVSVRNAPEKIFCSARGKITKFLYQYADGIVCQNQRAKEYFSLKLQRKIAVIPNMINPGFMAEPYEGTRRKRIVTVGRLVKQKNQILLIQAFELFHRIFGEWTLCIFGEGPERENLYREIKRLNLEHYVNLPGVVSHIAEEIYKDGMFVLSSDYEGMPNALLEAMALGLPCIAADCIGGGAKDLITDGLNGLLVQRNNCEALADAMAKIASDKNYADKLSVFALHVREELSPDKVFESWKDYLESASHPVN